MSHPDEPATTSPEPVPVPVPPPSADDAPVPAVDGEEPEDGDRYLPL